MPTVLGFVKATVIVVWTAILVLAITVFGMLWGAGLHWTDLIYLVVAGLAARELLDWLFE